MWKKRCFGLNSSFTRQEQLDLWNIPGSAKELQEDLVGTKMNDQLFQVPQDKIQMKQNLRDNDCFEFMTYVLLKDKLNLIEKKPIL